VQTGQQDINTQKYWKGTRPKIITIISIKKIELEFDLWRIIIWNDFEIFAVTHFKNTHLT
jgi:hypothetical protein